MSLTFENSSANAVGKINNRINPRWRKSLAKCPSHADDAAMVMMTEQTRTSVTRWRIFALLKSNFIMCSIRVDDVFIAALIFLVSGTAAGTRRWRGVSLVLASFTAGQVPAKSVV